MGWEGGRQTVKARLGHGVPAETTTLGYPLLLHHPHPSSWGAWKAEASEELLWRAGIRG